MKRIHFAIIIILFTGVNALMVWMNFYLTNKNNPSISDYVFDYYYDGKLKGEDAKKHSDFKIYSFKDAEEFIKQNRHLPYIDSRKKWEEYSKIPLEKLVSQQWVALEVLWLHTIEQQKQIDELKKLLSNDRIKNLSNQELIKILKENREVTKIPYEELKEYKIEFERRGLRLD